MPSPIPRGRSASSSHSTRSVQDDLALGCLRRLAGHYVLLTEPSTSPPGGLARNVADGTAAWIDAGTTLETIVRATIVEGTDLDTMETRSAPLSG